MAKKTARTVQPDLASDAVTKKKSSGGERHIDDDAGEQGAGHDGDAKKKATKGFTARNNNDNDSKDKNPDTKGGMKTKDPAFKAAGEKGTETQASGDILSNQDRPKAETERRDKNENKTSGKEKPKKKTSEKSSK